MHTTLTVESQSVRELQQVGDFKVLLKCMFKSFATMMVTAEL